MSPIPVIACADVSLEERPAGRWGTLPFFGPEPGPGVVARMAVLVGSFDPGAPEEAIGRLARLSQATSDLEDGRWSRLSDASSQKAAVDLTTGIELAAKGHGLPVKILGHDGRQVRARLASGFPILEWAVANLGGEALKSAEPLGLEFARLCASMLRGAGLDPSLRLDPEPIPLAWIRVDFSRMDGADPWIEAMGIAASLCEAHRLGAELATPIARLRSTAL